MINRIKLFWNATDRRTRLYNHNITYSLILKGLGIILSILILPITLKYLTNYEYGIWVTINSILTWINYFDIGLGNGLRNKLTEAIAVENYKLGREYVSTTFLLLSIIAILFGVMFSIANIFIDWNSFLNIDNSVSNLSEIIFIVIWCLCLNFILRTIGIIYISNQEIWKNNLMTFLGTLLSFCIILILSITTTGNLLYIAVVYSISPLIIYSIAYLISFNGKYKNLKPNKSFIKLREHSKSLGSLGIKFFLLQLTSLVLFSTSNVLISKYFSPLEVTPFNICTKYFNVIVMSFAIIVAPLWSSITDANKKGEYEWIISSMHKMLKYWIVFSIICLIMNFLSPLIYKLWIGNQVIIPMSLNIIIALYSIALMWGNVVASYSNGTGNLTGQIIISIISAVAFIPLSILLLRIGVIGIPISLLTVTIISAVWLTVCYKKDINRKLKSKSNVINDL